MQFRSNPLGVQVDGTFNEIEGAEDFAWDAIWDSAGRITDEVSGEVSADDLALRLAS